ncbi:MAG: hypothetical protein H7Z21_16745 [Hymenobacter sp.]|nr:hypothetical protein [Hymenobacter sp.]
MAGVQQGMGVAPSAWQYLLTTPGMIGVLNSMLAGVFTGLLTHFAGAASPYAGLGAGLVVFGLNAEAHRRYQSSQFREMNRRLVPRFPSTPPGSAAAD